MFHMQERQLPLSSLFKKPVHNDNDMVKKKKKKKKNKVSEYLYLG